MRELPGLGKPWGEQGEAGAGRGNDVPNGDRERDTEFQKEVK